MARHGTGGSSSPSPFSSLRGSELHLSLASTQHPGQPGRRPALEQAQEVRSQPLTAIRKLGEACQALPVEGPAQSSILAQLEFQAGMFSRWAVGQVQIPEAEVNALQRSFPAVSLQPPAGPSWEREGEPPLGLEQGHGDLGGSFSQVQAKPEVHFMCRALYTHVATLRFQLDSICKRKSTSLFSPLLFRLFSFSPYLNKTSGLMAFSGPF